MKEWEKAWDKVDLFDKWKPKSARHHWHEEAFRLGWDAGVRAAEEAYMDEEEIITIRRIDPDNGEDLS